MFRLCICTIIAIPLLMKYIVANLKLVHNRNPLYLPHYFNYVIFYFISSHKNIVINNRIAYKGLNGKTNGRQLEALKNSGQNGQLIPIRICCYRRETEKERVRGRMRERQRRGRKRGKQGKKENILEPLKFSNAGIFNMQLFIISLEIQTIEQ